MADNYSIILHAIAVRDARLLRLRNWPIRHRVHAPHARAGAVQPAAAWREALRVRPAR